MNLVQHFPERGADNFPAERLGGVARIEAVSPKFGVMFAGGAPLKNLADLIDNRKWDEIVDLCKKSIEIMKEVRNHG